MGLRTIHLKLHKPSAIKRKIIETAFINYNNAYNYLLKKAFEDITNIETSYKSPKGTYSTLGLSKWIDRDMAADLNKFDIQPFKDSIKLDFGMTMASYFAQKKINPSMGYPYYKQESATMQDRLRPVYFCRYDTKRSFCLLYDKKNNKYFAKLFIMNTKNAKYRGDQQIDRELFCISKGFEEARPLKKETFIIIPLAFGKWQEDMLKRAIEKPEILRTARLIMKENDFYISLSIDLPEDEKIEADTFLGISRGIVKAVNYTIADKAGRVLGEGSLDFYYGGNETRQKTDIFSLANGLVELAVKNKAMVILQNLVGKGDKLSWSEEGITHKPILGCRLYNDLVRIMEYKLPQRGLPAPARVSSVDIFHRCSLCGSNTKKNRFSKTMFICTTCGLSSELDSLGSLNLATKLIKYENTTVKLKARRTHDGMYLQNEFIGLDLFIPRNEDPFEKLKEEIRELYGRADTAQISNRLSGRDVNSIIGKLIKQDFANIEIV